MARMVPSEWQDRNGSQAEALMYRKLRDETPGDWIAVHSVGLTSHHRKPWAEIDFVVVGPFGVLCLEVKGGRVTVQDGAWSTNGRPLKESPFAQAGGGAAALHHELDGFPALRRGVVGHGVLLPDVRFDVSGPGIDPSLVYDERDLDRPMSDFIRRIAQHWLTFHGRTGERHRPLSRAERAEIGRYVAPSFDLVPTLRARVMNAEAELVRLTESQARILRGMQDQRRALIRGGAGTGKTLLAVDEAARFAAGGERVLFCCRSSNLARYVQQHVEEPLVDVLGYEQLLWGLVDDAGLRHEVPDADEADVLDVFLPEVAAEALAATGREGCYDVLVVDEAQDLMFEGALLVLDDLLRERISGGTWRFFLDHKQNVFSGVDLTQLRRVDGAATTHYDLVDNCRNTPEIAEMTALVSAVDPDETLAHDGPGVEVRWALERRDEPEVMGTLLDAWRRRGVDLGGVVVVATDHVVADRLRARWPARLPVAAALGATSPDAPRLTTAAEFKGLEAAAVVVVGIRELSELETLRRMYVACSRARVLLGIVLDESAREDFERRAVEFARRRGEMPDGVPHEALRS